MVKVILPRIIGLLFGFITYIPIIIYEVILFTQEKVPESTFSENISPTTSLYTKYGQNIIAANQSQGIRSPDLSQPIKEQLVYHLTSQSQSEARMYPSSSDKQESAPVWSCA